MAEIVTEQPVQDYEYFYKIIIIGDDGVGKSSLIIKYVDDAWTDTYISYIGVDFKTKTLQVDGKIVKLQIWDTYRSQRNCRSYRNAHGIILMYDITNRESYNNIKQWLGEVERYAKENVTRYIVGNKLDIEQNRQVSFEEARKLFCDDFEFRNFMEISVKENGNVEQLFVDLASSIMRTPPAEPASSHPTKNQRHDASKCSLC